MSGFKDNDEGLEKAKEKGKADNYSYTRIITIKRIG
jgi:hypothetical protein